MKLVSKYDDAEARKQASRLKVPPKAESKRTEKQAPSSPKNSTYNLSTQRTRASEQSPNGRRTEMGDASEASKQPPLKSM